MGCETSRGVFGRTAFHTCHVTGNGNDERPVGMFGLRKATESVGHPTDTLLKSTRPTTMGHGRAIMPLSLQQHDGHITKMRNDNGMQAKTYYYVAFEDIMTLMSMSVVRRCSTASWE